MMLWALGWRFFRNEIAPHCGHETDQVTIEACAFDNAA